MDSPSLTAADRRNAHRRVGAAAVAAFVALLLVAAGRGPAMADTTVPAAVPTVTPQPQPADPRRLPPGFDRDRGGPGDGDGDGGGFGGRGGGFDGGGGSAPAPSTGTTSDGGQT